MKNETAPLQNVMIFREMVNRLKNKAEHLPKMGLFYGYSGYGKTKSAIFGANEAEAYYVYCQSYWSQKDFVEAMLMEVGGDASGSKSTMMKELIRLLSLDNRPLIIDEADYLFDKGYFNILRDIHDMVSCPIIMIGEENLAAKVRNKGDRRFYARTPEKVLAQPCNLADAQSLAEISNTDIIIADDLLLEMIKIHKGVARDIVNSIDVAVKFAKSSGLKNVSLTIWRDNKLVFDTGEAPKRG